MMIKLKLESWRTTTRLQTSAEHAASKGSKAPFERCIPRDTKRRPMLCGTSATPTMAKPIRIQIVLHPNDVLGRFGHFKVEKTNHPYPNQTHHHLGRIYHT